MKKIKLFINKLLIPNDIISLDKMINLFVILLYDWFFCFNILNNST